jgi:hypothetical protein
MRKLSYILIILIISFSGCEDYDTSDMLDKEEVNDIYFDQIFQNPQYAYWFLTTL